MLPTQYDRRSCLRYMMYGSAAVGSQLFNTDFVDAAPIGPDEKIKVTKIETFVLKNSWVFVKISTDAGITGWGEMLKDDAKACAAGALPHDKSCVAHNVYRPYHLSDLL